jgi:hypothetical protein
MTSEPRTYRIDDQEDENWIDNNIQKGDLNQWINQQIHKGIRDEILNGLETEQEEKTDRRISLFGMFMFLFMGFVFICYALAPYQILIQSILSSLFLITGVLVILYVSMNIKKKPVKGVN